MPEVLATRKLLQQLQDVTPNCTSRFYLTGNHEDWIEQAKVAKLPELFDGIEQLLPPGVDLGLKTFLNLDHFGYELLPLNHLLQIGKASLPLTASTPTTTTPRRHSRPLAKTSSTATCTT